MGGKGAQKRYLLRKAALQKEAKKAAKECPEDYTPLVIPPINEADLLAFQLAHFGDDVKPEEWFVDAETALSYDPALEDDDLGYYDDGVKRTLTDAQIEMFRHSELEVMMREHRLRAEQDGTEMEHERYGMATSEEPKMTREASPISDASSVEGELLGLAHPAKEPSPPPALEVLRSHDSRGWTSHSTDPKTRQRAYETPYEQRHKRKWEAYIDENDPIEGSLTHRRIVREMDEQRDESVDLDY